MSKGRSVLLWLAGAGVGSALLWLALRSADLEQVRGIVAAAHWPDLLAIVACGLAFVAVKAARWALLVRHLAPLSFRQLVGPAFAGSAANYVVPHGGEIVRAWLVAARHRIPKAAVLGTIAVERVLDFCAVLMLGLVAMIAGREALQSLRSYLWVLTGFIVIMLAVALPFALRPHSGQRALLTLLSPLPASARDWLAGHLQHAIQGLGSLQAGALLFRCLGLSLVQWTLMAGCAWFSLRGAGVQSDPSLALVILLLLVVGLTLPAAPGHVGTTQVAFLLAAAPFAVGSEEALAASLLYNVFLPAPILLVGAVMLLRARKGAWRRSPH